MKRLLSILICCLFLLSLPAYAEKLVDGKKTVGMSLIPENILPASDDAYDIGSATFQWKNGYFDGTLEGDVLTEGGVGVYNQTQSDGAYQPLEATLTDIADGTIAENLVNTANPWADNEMADAHSHAADAIDTLTEIAAALKSGSDAKLITGTAGTNTYAACWDANGDIIDCAGVPYTVGGTNVAIADGGTGAGTTTAGFDALSPMTTIGDIIYGGASGTGTRLGAGAEGTLLMGNGAAAPSWLGAGTSGYFLIGAGAADPIWTTQPTLTSLEGLTFTNGDIIYASGADTLVVLNNGGDGALLMANGVAAPSWLAAGTSGYMLVAAGASDPVWTLNTGTGAPVRGTSPTIATPVMTIKRYYPATLNDTSTPHLLTIAEVSNTLITTQGWNGTDDIEFDLPDISSYDGTEGVLKVKFLDSKGMQDADTDFYIDPDASTQIVLDGTITGTDGDRIWEDDVTIYNAITCHSEYDSTLAGYWVCDSIVGTWGDKGS